MRKYFMMAFMVMVVSMMAAGNAIAADVNAVFMAGAAKADITPEVFPLTRAPKVTITGVRALLRPCLCKSHSPSYRSAIGEYHTHFYPYTCRTGDNRARLCPHCRYAAWEESA